MNQKKCLKNHYHKYSALLVLVCSLYCVARDVLGGVKLTVESADVARLPSCWDQSKAAACADGAVPVSS